MCVCVCVLVLICVADGPGGPGANLRHQHGQQHREPLHGTRGGIRRQEWRRLRYELAYEIKRTHVVHILATHKIHTPVLVHERTDAQLVFWFASYYSIMKLSSVRATFLGFFTWCGYIIVIDFMFFLSLISVFSQLGIPRDVAKLFLVLLQFIFVFFFIILLCCFSTGNNTGRYVRQRFLFLRQRSYAYPKALSTL